MNTKQKPSKSKIAWIAATAVVAVVVAAVPGPRHAVLEFFNLATVELNADAYYTCPMHPQIRLPQPGECPICGMTLVEKKAGSDDQTGRISVTTRQAQLTGVTVEPVAARKLYRKIDAYGEIDYDETKLGIVSAWIGGRIDRLYVDYTGISVEKGHPLVWLYSPELIATENEFLLAMKNLDKIRPSGRSMEIKNAEQLVGSTRQRLVRWGLSERQLDGIAKTEKVEDHITIYAPQGGTVLHKQAYEGMYVKEGDALFRIADLSTLWMNAEIYEDDIPVLYASREGDYYQCPMHPGNTAEQKENCPDCGMEMIRMNDDVSVDITTRAFPGERFKGKIAFTDPFLNPDTRTVRVRVNIDNKDQKLKPKMFARAAIEIPVGTVLSVPEDAVLHTGERTIALVEEVKGTFRPQPVRLGRMWLDDYGRSEEERKALIFRRESSRYHEVLGGLSVGERVVTSGNFLVGSESQLQGALAKMLESESEAELTAADPDDGGGDGERISLSVEPEFDTILDSYDAVRVALTKDSIEGIPAAADKLLNVAKNKAIKDAAEPLRHAQHKNDIEATRKDFKILSEVLVTYVETHKTSFERLPLKAYCPMKDANWIQKGGDLENPFYGSKMPFCGSFKPW